MPNQCNIPSRTIFTGDNLDILRGINSELEDNLTQMPCRHFCGL